MTLESRTATGLAALAAACWGFGKVASALGIASSVAMDFAAPSQCFQLVAGRTYAIQSELMNSHTSIAKRDAVIGSAPLIETLEEAAHSFWIGQGQDREQNVVTLSVLREPLLIEMALLLQNAVPQTRWGEPRIDHNAE